MPDDQLPAYERPTLGTGLAAVLDRYAELLKRRTNLEAVIQPFPVEQKQLVLELVPAGFRVERDGPHEGWGDAPQRYRLELSHLVVLTGAGHGGLFVAECLEASFRCEVRLGSPPLNVPLGPGRFATAQLAPRPDNSGKFFESEGEGRDYLFERTWDGTLFIPITVADGEPTTGDTASPHPSSFRVEVDLG